MDGIASTDWQQGDETLGVPPSNYGLTDEAESFLETIKKRIKDVPLEGGRAELSLGSFEDHLYFFGLLCELAGKSQIDVTGTLSITIPSQSYQDYLESGRWKHKRDQARERAGHRCQVCNAKGPILDTHHRTYERIGNELPEDLIVLCRPCHDTFHEQRKLARHK